MSTDPRPPATLESLLKSVAEGALDVASARRMLSEEGIHDLGFARVDLHRPRRRGMPEVIFCAGKTAAQVVGIIGALKQAGQSVLGTRASPELFQEVLRAHPEAVYHETARCLTLEGKPRPPPVGSVAVVCAGTTDLPVAEEAALTAEWMGARVEVVRDVGVAGLHRLFKHLDVLRRARAVVVVAGMEGALPSVVGGLIDRPIIAVPTSVGYGAHFQGLAPLLTMLNSCAPGITVVNIDNGFGAGAAAALINRIGESP